MTSYNEFLKRKALVDPATGLREIPPLNNALFDFQRDIVSWALRRGRAAVFADCGMGKTPIQLEWAKHVPGDVLILAPLAVATQTVREGEKFGIEVRYCRDQSEVRPGITVANYEMLAHFSPEQFSGVVLDESSIIKAYNGKTRTQIIDAFCNTPFRLACTATPAPNDYMELGNHAEFLGVMTRAEMLAMFFVHDGGDTSQWRLKGHAEAEFWKWLCSWAVMIRKPSDLGYDDGDFILPEMVMHQVEVRAEKATDGFLFPVEALTLQERLRARKDTVDERASVCYKLINENERAIKGIQPQIPCEERREAEGEGEEMVGGKQGKRGQNPAQGIYACVSNGESGQVQADACAAEEIQRDAQAAVCNRSGSQREVEESGKRVAAEKSSEAQGAEVEEVWNNHRADDRCNGETKSRVRNLRGDGHEREESFSGCGSLPRYGKVSGDSLREMQQGHRSFERQSGSVARGSGVFGDQWIVWCNLNSEQEALERLFGKECVSIYGSLDAEEKEKRLLAWLGGSPRILLSKPSITGYGINMQNCANMAFVGLSDSYEQFYQAVRRCWRFGQRETVNVYVITAETEGAVVANIKRKEADAMAMAENMVEHMQELNAAALHGATNRQKADYVRDVQSGDGWTAHLADCVDVAKEIETDSLHFSVYSPPFASLYTYSNSDRDMGNSKSDAEFMEHYRFLVRELFRATMPGRLTAFHCMNLPTSKTHHGYIGIQDFRGDLIRTHMNEGWIYHSEVCIWKDPVTAMQRTKALGLLWKQLKKDSCMSRQAIPDYLVVMRKPGENPERVSHTDKTFPVDLWQNYASPVWMDINPSDTLQFRSARAHNDERHICPLQLAVIERAIQLWSNSGDLVFSPFMGIGSEGYVALQMGRRFLGSELKRSYWEQACRNLDAAKANQCGLFAG